MNTSRKKFPKVSPGNADADDPGIELDDDTVTTRNAKVRGGIEVLHIKTDDTFNPYEREPEDRRKDRAKRDLRKLSEHIKLMRDLEERKKETGEE